MAHRGRTFDRTSARRRGIATLEFVMALPVLLLLMVGITWLGFSVIGQTEVLVEARNKAWKRRFEDASKKPLYFPLLKGLYNEKADYVTERSSKRLRVSPVFDSLPGPEASHTILAGSWDHAAMKLDAPPDVKLMGVAAGIGLFGNALNVGASLDDPLGLINKLANASSFADQQRRQTDREAAGVGKDVGGNGGDSAGTAPGDGPDLTPEQADAKTKEEQEVEKRELIRRYQKLGGKYEIFGVQAGQIIPESGDLRKAFDERGELKDQYSRAVASALQERDEEKKKQLQAEAERLGRKLEVSEIKYARLQAEAQQLVQELKAIGMNDFQIAQL